MWSEIFNSNHLTSHDRIRNLLRNDLEFESVYHKVINGNFSKPERDALTLAVQQAYENLDSTLLRWTPAACSTHPLNIYGLQRFIAEFVGSVGQPGFVFTLNQDLFMERHHYNPVGVPHPVVPGVRAPTNVRWFSTAFRQPVDATTTATLPEPKDTAQRVNDDIQNAPWCYVKLHGSYGWRKPDGMTPFVIGRDKRAAIWADPLLKCYFELFEGVLQQQDRRLLVIGYGFRDEHINVVLAKAVKERGLKLYIVCPTEPASFKDDLDKQRCGEELWAGLHGYFPYTLRQLFPESQDDTLAANQLRQALFR